MTPEQIDAVSRMSNDDYHAHEAIGSSKLKVFRESRKRYYQQFIAKTLVFTQTPAMLLGSLVHCMVLEPTEYPQRYAIAPKCDRRTKEGKDTWQAFSARIPSGAEVITQELHDQAELIANELLANPVASRILSLGGVTEHAVFWIDRDTGLPCRAKYDMLCMADNLILDIKTTTDASPGGFARSVANFGYARQAAWYLEGYRRLFDHEASFVFLAVETSPPYEVGLYELSADELKRAHQQNRVLMEALNYCQINNEWQGRHEREIVTLALPKYAQFEDEYASF